MTSLLTSCHIQHVCCDQIWDDLPQTTINKAISDFPQTSERVRCGRLWILCELGSRA